MKKIYSSLTALTFLCSFAFCACINTDASAAEKTDQSRFYFHAAKKYESNKKRISMLIPTTIFGHGILFIQISLILAVHFCLQQSQNL